MAAVFSAFFCCTTKLMDDSNRDQHIWCLNLRMKNVPCGWNATRWFAHASRQLITWIFIGGGRGSMHFTAHSNCRCVLAWNRRGHKWCDYLFSLCHWTASIDFQLKISRLNRVKSFQAMKCDAWLTKLYTRIAIFFSSLLPNTMNQTQWTIIDGPCDGDRGKDCIFHMFPHWHVVQF